MSQFDYPVDSFEYRAYERLVAAGFSQTLHPPVLKAIIETIAPAHEKHLEDMEKKIDDRVHSEFVKAVKPVKSLVGDMIADLKELESKL